MSDETQNLSPAHLRAMIQMVGQVSLASTLHEAQLAVSIYAETVKQRFGVDPALRQMTLGEIARRWPIPEPFEAQS